MTVIPQLEDNIDITTFNILAQLALELLPTVKIARNPGHLSDGVLANWPGEIHPCTAHQSWIQGGIITNDGCTYNFPGEWSDGYPQRTSFEEVKAMRDKAVTLNSTFLLWKADVQGLGSHNLPPPAQRHYRVLSPNDIELLKNFMKGL